MRKNSAARQSEVRLEPVPEDLLESAIAELSAIEHRAGWERVEKIVEIISKYFFDSDDAALQRPSTSRIRSLRALASHPGCPLSKSQLHGVLAAHQVYRSDSRVRRSEFLTPSHVAAAAQLEPGERTNVLRAAEERRLSVRDLTALVRDLRRRGGEKRGRPPTSFAEKAVTRYENGVLCLQEGNDLLAHNPVPADVRLRLARILEQARRSIERGIALLGTSEARPLVSSYPSRVAPLHAGMARKSAS